MSEPKIIIHRANGVAEVVRGEVISRAPCLWHDDDVECDDCRGELVDGGFTYPTDSTALPR